RDHLAAADGALRAGGAPGVVEDACEPRARHRALDVEASRGEGAVEAGLGHGQAEKRHRVVGAEGARLRAGACGGREGDEGGEAEGGEAVLHGFSLAAEFRRFYGMAGWRRDPGQSLRLT